MTPFHLKAMPGERSLEPFNEYHQLRLRVTFQHIDSLLTDVEHILVDAQSGSPFNVMLSRKPLNPPPICTEYNFKTVNFPCPKIRCKRLQISTG